MTGPRPSDPNPDRPAPDVGDETKSTATPADSNEAPDKDTPAWQGAEPDDAVGLIDPRPEIPSPPGL